MIIKAIVTMTLTTIIMIIMRATRMIMNMLIILMTTMTIVVVILDNTVIDDFAFDVFFSHLHFCSSSTLLFVHAFVCKKLSPL